MLASTALNTLSPNAASPSPLNSSRAFRFMAASSWSVRLARPASTFGRSSGAALLLTHTPWKSGWPSGVRGTLHGSGAGRDCAATGALVTCADSATTSAANAANAAPTRRYRSFMVWVTSLFYREPLSLGAVGTHLEVAKDGRRVGLVRVLLPGGTRQLRQTHAVEG